jgi:hypothetical protein
MGALRMATSNATPFSISALSGTAALNENESLCSLAFSNCGPSSSSAVFQRIRGQDLDLRRVDGAGRE